MQLLGLCFAGTATTQASAMAGFLTDVLGLPSSHDAGADFFLLPDGSRLAVAAVDRPDQARRMIGFQVADLDQAAAELRSAGIQVDEPRENSTMRYVHFVAPDEASYELVELKTPAD